MSGFPWPPMSDAERRAVQIEGRTARRIAERAFGERAEPDEGETGLRELTDQEKDDNTLDVLEGSDEP